MLQIALVGLVALVAVANLAIVAASAAARQLGAGANPELDGVAKVRVVDDRVWRGGAPTAQGYRSLAEAGFRTVVDLRAEESLAIDEELLAELGIERVSIPIRDGQVPTAAEVQRFLDVVAGSDSRVFLHCGAGVGRTGSMTAAYLAATQQDSRPDALVRTLAVGPPSIEQLAFVAGLHDDEVPKVNAALVALSRVVDAPRRIWASAGSGAGVPQNAALPFAALLGVVAAAFVWQRRRQRALV